MNNQLDQKLEQLEANLTSAIEAYVKELVKRELSQVAQESNFSSTDSVKNQFKQLNLSEVSQKLSNMVKQIKARPKKTKVENLTFSLAGNNDAPCLAEADEAVHDTGRKIDNEFDQLLKSIESTHSRREQSRKKLENNLGLLENYLGSSSEEELTLVDQVNQLQRSFMASNQTDSRRAQDQLFQLERTVARLMDDRLTVGEKKSVNDLYQILDRVKQNRYS